MSRPTMSEAHQVAARVVSERCCKRFCLAKDSDAPLLVCTKEGCPKKIHTLCYQELVFKPQKAKDEEKGIVTNLLGENQVACDGKHQGQPEDGGPLDCLLGLRLFGHGPGSDIFEMLSCITATHWERRDTECLNGNLKY